MIIENAEAYRLTTKTNFLNKNAENVASAPQLVEPRISARRAPWSGEKEESASHHLFIIICFAQLRAETAENDARRRQETSRNAKKLNFGIIPNTSKTIPGTGISVERLIICITSEQDFE